MIASIQIRPYRQNARWITKVSCKCNKKPYGTVTENNIQIIKNIYNEYLKAISIIDSIISRYSSNKLCEYKEYIAITTCKHLKAKYIPANIFEKINNEILDFYKKSPNLMMFYEYEFQDNSILDPLLIKYNSYKPVKFTKLIEDVFNKLKTIANNITVNNLENNLSLYITIYEKFLDFMKEYIINDQSNYLDRYKNAIRYDGKRFGCFSYTIARSGLNELKKCNYNDDDNIYINENETYEEEEHESNENILLFSKSNIAKDVDNNSNTLDITTRRQKLNKNLENIKKLFRNTLSNICDICKNF